MAAPRGSEVWRDFVADGIPSSGANNPKKSDIRSWAGWLENLVTSGVLSAGPWFATKAAMTLAYAANTIAIVYNDPIAANNGLYIKAGASGSGSWTQLTSFLPGYQFVTASPTGASTPNAIIALTSPRLPSGDGVALVTLAIPATNTASPVTVRFDGGAVLTIKTRTGEDPDGGELQQNDVVAGFVSGATFRLISDLNSLRNFQSAKAWANNDEDVPVSASLGGDGVTTFSAKHWAAKSEEDADRSDDEADRAQVARVGAESAAGVAAGFVEEIVSEKEVPITGTRNGMESLQFPQGMNSLEVRGYTTMGDGGKAQMIRAVAEPTHSLKVRSADRWLPNGSTDPANGGWWEIGGEEIRAEIAGFVTDGGTPAGNAAAVQACIDYLYRRGGGIVRFKSGRTKMNPVIMRDRVFLQGEGRTNTYLELANGANADFIKSSAFDEFADGVKRGYRYYATEAERNAAALPVGSYAMVSNSLDNFKDAQWFVATSGPATSDVNWTPCGPVIGMIGGGIRGLSILGNRQNQTGRFWGLALYGVGIIIDDVEVRSASKAAYFECPGALLGSFGFTLQWSVNKFNCRDFDKEGCFNNMQSDGVVADSMIAGAEFVAIDYMLKFGTKATGQKWVGGHLWGGSNGDPGIIFEGGGNTLVDFEVERAIHIKSTAGGTTVLGGKSYRINNASREVTAAFIIDPAVNSCYIQTRVSHFRHCVKFTGSVGIAQKWDINFYSEDPAAAYLDPSGTTAEGSLALNRNWFEFRASFSGLRAMTYIPFQVTGVLRPRELAIAGNAGSISPNLDTYQVYRCLGMTSDITVNNPENGKVSDRLTFNFGQDAVGGRSVIWGSNFRGAPAGAGGVFQYRIYEFVFNGTFWVYAGGTGAWV